MLVNLCRSLGKKIPANRSAVSFGTAPHKGKFFSRVADSHAVEERKVTVDGEDINYVRVGTGDHPVLLQPGGSIWSDLKPQVEGLDRRKFTVVAWDPPGCGKSRPIHRSFAGDFVQRDAVKACKLMKALGYTRFSLIGWCLGGVTSLILAAMFPDNVRRIVTVGANAYIRPEEVELFTKLRNIRNWSEQMRAPLMAVYGEEYFQELCARHVDALLRIYETRNGDLCKESLSKIKCPTLIVQGNKDVIICPEQAIYLKEHIHGSKLKMFDEGRHDVHLQYPDVFNELATEFLTE
ncbi:serine hydrolase BPHL-like isoform X2 [Andrena cerasifolii]|uniref:serine hydrolase BPHL-like isoform X2 n=1 Tax=Andrena cerasifolii TaxID=2819439 RepID=UPI004037AB6B